MESELDLRPMFRALFRRWWLIAAFATTIALAFTGVALVQPPVRSATANLLIIPLSNQVTLDPRFVTSDVASNSNAPLQREGMIALASSNTLEDIVLANLSPDFGPSRTLPRSLLEDIQIKVEGDLLQVVASDRDEARAKLIAETWAKSYQQLIEELYNGDARLSKNIEAQLTDAEQRYNESQQKLETFIASSTLAELEQRIVNLQTLLTNAANADQQLYVDYLKRVREIDLVIADARTVRDQVANGRVDSLGNALAILSLRSRAAGTVDLPFTLNFNDPAAIGEGTTVSVEDIDQLTAILQQRRIELLDQAQGLARSLAAGDGDLIGLASQIRQRYVKELTELVRQQEVQSSQQRLFQQRRDISLESLKLLQSKSDEQQIARRSPQIEIQYINASIDQPASLTRRIVIDGVVSLCVGLFVGIFLVLFFDMALPALRRLNAAPSATGEVAAQSEPKMIG